MLNHWLLDCLFYNLFRLTTKITWNLYITGPLWGEPTSNAESIYMSWLRHVCRYEFCMKPYWIVLPIDCCLLQWDESLRVSLTTAICMLYFSWVFPNSGTVMHVFRVCSHPWESVCILPWRNMGFYTWLVLNLRSLPGVLATWQFNWKCVA